MKMKQVIALAGVAMAVAMALPGCGGGREEGAPPVRTAATIRAQDGADGLASAEARIAGYRNGYTIENRDGTVTVASKTDARDVHVFPGVALVKFFDKWTSFDVDGSSGRIYRMYQAAFHRRPDAAGLGFWIRANQDGRDLESIAGDFIASEEFGKRYGDKVSPLAFVEALYTNILERPGEPAGIAWWVARIDDGLARRAALSGFAESAENRDRLLPDMANGFDFVPSDPPGPIVPMASSYDNKMRASRLLGPLPLPVPGNGEIVGTGYAYADFLQDGSYSLVAATSNFGPEATDAHGVPDKPGKVHFYQRVDGAWVDRSAQLLVDQTSCISPRKAIVADFNGDGKPDVFLACHGYDAEPFPGERQRILLSQPDGTYSNVEMPVTCFCHGAAAADIEGNGHADILVADQMVERTPYFLLNNRDGTFTPDKSRLPDLSYKKIWTAELVDTTGSGQFDVFLAGADPEGTAYEILPTIFRADGGKRYSASNAIALQPSSVGHVGNGVTLDAVFDGGNVYLLRTFGYEAVAIQKTQLSTGLSSELYAHAGSYNPLSNTQNWMWFPWIAIHRGQIISMDPQYDVRINR